MELDPQLKTPEPVTAAPLSQSLPGDDAAESGREAPLKIDSDKVIYRGEVASRDTSLPIPAGPLRRGPARTSLWKRIKMRTRGENPDAGAALVAARLTAIEHQISSLEVETRDRFNALSQRLDEVWECEEQLSLLAELQERAEKVTQSQSDVGASLDAITGKIGTLTWAIVMIAVFSVASLLAGLALR
jgi:hypothetical protein